MQMHFPGRVGGRLEGWADPQQLQLQVDVELYAIQKAVDAMQDTDHRFVAAMVVVHVHDMLLLLLLRLLWLRGDACLRVAGPNGIPALNPVTARGGALLLQKNLQADQMAVICQALFSAQPLVRHCQRLIVTWADAALQEAPTRMAAAVASGASWCRTACQVPRLATARGDSQAGLPLAARCRNLLPALPPAVDARS